MDEDEVRMSVRLSPDNWARFQALEFGLSLLGGDPQRFHFVQRQVGEAGRLFDRAEALLELAIGFSQRGFRFDVQMSCEVNDGEQQVAKLIEHARMLGFGVEFGQFLVDLGARAGGVGPVEADASRAALQLGGAFERRKRQRNAGQGAVVARFCAFGGLDFLPAVGCGWRRRRCAGGGARACRRSGRSRRRA